MGSCNGRYTLQPLPENPTLAQIRSHSVEKIKKFKAKIVIQNSVADSIFSKSLLVRRQKKLGKIKKISMK